MSTFEHTTILDSPELSPGSHENTKNCCLNRCVPRVYSVEPSISGAIRGCNCLGLCVITGPSPCILKLEWFSIDLRLQGKLSMEKKGPIVLIEKGPTFLSESEARLGEESTVH